MKFTGGRAPFPANPVKRFIWRRCCLFSPPALHGHAQEGALANWKCAMQPFPEHINRPPQRFPSPPQISCLTISHSIQHGLHIWVVPMTSRPGFRSIPLVNCRHNRARVFRRNGASSKCSKNSLGRFFQNGRFTSFFAFVFSVFRSLYFCCCGPDGVAR